MSYNHSPLKYQFNGTSMVTEMCNYSTINPRTFYHPGKKLHIHEHVSIHPDFAPYPPPGNPKLHSIPTDLPLGDISRKWNSHQLCGRLSPGSSQRHYSNILKSLSEQFFFWLWIILKSLLLLQCCFCFVFLAMRHVRS